MEYGEKNNIVVSGKIVSEPKLRFSTDYYSMYQFKIHVARRSGAYDELIVQADERLIEGRDIKVGDKYKVVGDIRTYKNLNPEDGEGRLLVCVSAKVMKKINVEQIIEDNECEFIGSLKRKREMKRGKDNSPIREFVVEVTRDKYGKVCYIPCVSWKANAEMISNIDDGTVLLCKGRLQSREYTNSVGSNMVCYEVAVKSIESIGECLDEV